MKNKAKKKNKNMRFVCEKNKNLFIEIARKLSKMYESYSLPSALPYRHDSRG